MIAIRLETQTYLDAVEQFAHRKFQFRDDLGLLTDLSESRNMKQLFDDILFFAKFVSNANNVLKRAGVHSEETQKLSAEFKESLEKSSTLLRTLVKEAPEEVKKDFTARFFSLSQESVSNLLSLLYELSWIKNYSLDKHRAR